MTFRGNPKIRRYIKEINKSISRKVEEESRKAVSEGRVTELQKEGDEQKEKEKEPERRAS